MAKKRGNRANRNQKRVQPINANPLPPRLLLKPVTTHPVPLTQLQDRRTRSFGRSAIQTPNLTVNLTSALTTSKYLNRNDPFRKHSEKIRITPDAIICLRRKIRREVILATGRGGGNHRKKYKTNSNTKVKCK